MSDCRWPRGTLVVVVIDEGVDLGLEIAGQIVVLEQDAVLQRLVPAPDEGRARDQVVSLEQPINRCSNTKYFFTSVKRVATSRGDSSGASSASSTICSRISSGIRFHTRQGREGLSSSASGPPACKRAYQR